MNNIGSQADAAVTDPASEATLTAALKGLLSLLAGELSVQPFAAIAETGLATLVGADDQVDQNDYGAPVAVALGSARSGEILAATFVSTEAGTGAVQRPAGKLLVLDTNPSVSAGATALGAAHWPAVIGTIDVEAGDWTTADASGAAAFVPAQPIPFHAVSTLYLVWFHEDATSFNDAAGDDETLRVNLWYRRDS